MIVYRAMCEEEFQDTIKSNSLSWKGRFKWFGTKEFIEERVTDGKFNNSRFVHDRYCRIIIFEISDESLIYFSKVGHRELMLDRRKSPLIQIQIKGTL
ncbi:MAG: hypothetical protein PHC28_12535 [Flavobacterium sp.]|uniref:hypothetical protein n=1 Tax=Flavobacterium sp. TaxID=239 RepID=UPI00261C0C7B|nr:hypothetical protein [Flavobacterium sp.]MDD5151279.1 hypothetical protein [Flavobacterium sp.]